MNEFTDFIAKAKTLNPPEGLIEYLEVSKANDITLAVCLSLFKFQTTGAFNRWLEKNTITSLSFKQEKAVRHETAKRL